VGWELKISKSSMGPFWLNVSGNFLVKKIRSGKKYIYQNMEWY